MSVLTVEREGICGSGEDRKIKVLYLDDDYIDHKLMELALRCKGAGPVYDLTCMFDIEDTRDALRHRTIDIFVLDNQMPTSPDFHETLARIGTIDPDTKIVVVSSEIDGRVFKDMDHLDRKPDAIVDKAQLRAKIRDGLFRDL